MSAAERPATTVVVSVTAAGAALAGRLPYEHRHGQLGDTVRELWDSTDRLVLVAATGIAVRVIAPLLSAKHTDPAVVCLDDGGRWAVALTGGHHGANALAREVAALIGADPVVTTATDAAGLPALDDLPGFRTTGDLTAVTRAWLDGTPPLLDRTDLPGWPLPPPLAALTGPPAAIGADRPATRAADDDASLAPSAASTPSRPPAAAGSGTMASPSPGETDAAIGDGAETTFSGPGPGGMTHAGSQASPVAPAGRDGAPDRSSPAARSGAGRTPATAPTPAMTTPAPAAPATATTPPGTAPAAPASATTAPATTTPAPGSSSHGHGSTSPGIRHDRTGHDDTGTPANATRAPAKAIPASAPVVPATTPPATATPGPAPVVPATTTATTTPAPAAPATATTAPATATPASAPVVPATTPPATATPASAPVVPATTPPATATPASAPVVQTTTTATTTPAPAAPATATTAPATATQASALVVPTTTGPATTAPATTAPTTTPTPTPVPVTVVRVTDRVVEAAAGEVVLRPGSLVVAVGSSSGADPGGIAELVAGALAAAGLSPDAVGLVASVDLKRDEAGIVALADDLGVELRTFPAEALAAVDVPTPSPIVAAAVGTPSVAEAAAVLAAGPGADLVVSKQRSPEATVAVARRVRPEGHLAVVGLGPGDPAWRTPAAAAAVRRADVVVGYDLYVDLAADLLGPHHEVVRSPIGAETDRCRTSLERAAAGQRVALVCSGDPGVFAMASLVCELAPTHGGPPTEVIPGVTAAYGAAAVLGAPLGHDHAMVSLSDLLTPWDLIERRLVAVAEGDLTVALYNPRSRRRTWQLGRAVEILAAHRPADCPVAVVSDVGRAGRQRVVRTTLARFDPAVVDMLSLVIVGSTTTRWQADTMVTPRGYPSTAPNPAPVPDPVPAPTTAVGPA